MRRAAIGAVLAAPISALVFAQSASAHALVAREDLPIPAWLFAWAASVVLIVSFFALSVLWKQPRFEREDWRPWGGGLSRALLNPVAEVAAGLIGVFLLGVAVWSGLHGTEAPDRNFALTFLFVTCWLGFPLFSVLLGDVFPPFSPWRAIGRATGGAFRALTGQRPVHLRYPERLGRWPAALGLVAFVWLELIYGAGGLTAGLTPHVTAVAVIGLQRLHAGDDGDLRRRGMVAARRDVRGLLQHVLPALGVRGPRPPHRASLACSRGRPTGRPSRDRSHSWSPRSGRRASTGPRRGR